MKEFREMCADIARSMRDKLASKGLANVSGYWYKPDGCPTPSRFDVPAYVVPVYVEPVSGLGLKGDHDLDHGSAWDWVSNTLHHLGVRGFDWAEFNNRCKKLVANGDVSCVCHQRIKFNGNTYEPYYTYSVTRPAAVKLATKVLPDMVNSHILRLESESMQAKMILEPVTILTDCVDLFGNRCSIIERRPVTADNRDWSSEYDSRLGDPAEQANYLREAKMIYNLRKLAGALNAEADLERGQERRDERD